MNNAEKRAAFYQAAANIEARPDLYDFDRGMVGEEDCPACMWGHVGRCLGLGDRQININVARALGFNKTSVLYYHDLTSDLDQPLIAAKILRAFADKHFPINQNPAHEPAGVSFSELMASLNEVSA